MILVQLIKNEQAINQYVLPESSELETILTLNGFTRLGKVLVLNDLNDFNEIGTMYLGYSTTSSKIFQATKKTQKGTQL